MDERPPAPSEAGTDQPGAAASPPVGAGLRAETPAAAGPGAGAVPAGGLPDQTADDGAGTGTLGGDPGDRPAGAGSAAAAGEDAPTAAGEDDRPAELGTGPEAVGAAGEDAPTEVIRDDRPAGRGAEDAPTAAGGATAAGVGSGPAGPGGPPPPLGPPLGAYPPGSAGFPPGPPPAGERRLRRSTQRKVVAGVAGGLGEYTGIDPVLFRVLFAVLTLFGGTGVLLYVVGWLFLPADDQPASPAEALIGRGRDGSSRARDAATAAVLVLIGLFLAGVLARGDAGDVVLLLVVAGGAYFVGRNLTERREGGPPPPAPAPPPPVAYQAFEPAYPQAATAVVTPPAPAPVRHRPRRVPSILGAVTVSVLLVVLGITAALDAGDAVQPAPEDYLALTVGVLGLGLVVGAWYGRARGLIWLGLPLVLALVVIGSSGISLEGGAGDRRYAPQRAAQIEEEYRVGVGNLRLDLTDVDFTEQLVRTKLSAGVGNVEVLLPPDVDVSIDARAGLGEVNVLGRTENGTAATRSVVDHGSSGDGSIDLVLDLDVNIGQVEVDRA